MKFRLSIIILIGLIATGITLYLNNLENDGSNPQILSFTKPVLEKKRIKERPVKVQNPILFPNNKYLATHRSEALAISKASPARVDPFAPIDNIESIDKKLKKQTEVDGKANDLPPPPDETNQNGLLPPPPVMSGMDLPPDPSQSILTSELPLPPENQELNKELSLNAVVGDKAILAFNDSSYARAHDYDKYITLGRGDRFQTLKLVDIADDMVVVEENGFTHELKLTNIR